MRDETKDVVAEDRQSLWLLTVSPAIWAAHFLVSYIGSALWCGVPSRALEPVRIAIAGLAIIALIAIGITGRIGWRKHKHESGQQPPHDEDTPEDRHRFLGYATVLLSALSAVATVYVAIVALFIQNCA
jgi:hypothetical protein